MAAMAVGGKLRERTASEELLDSLVPTGDLNDRGTAAALDRRMVYRRKSFSQRALVPLTVGGLRQSVITLVQTSLGGGVLALAFAMKLSGLGLGSFLMLVLGLLAFLSMEVLMRGAIKLQTFNTSALLAMCVGSWSGPAMDALLVLYGNGAMVAYFILLGDFLPAIYTDLVELGWVKPTHLDAHDLRTTCILSTLLVVLPLCLPRKLSGLRYASPVALVSVLFTAAVVVCKAPRLFADRWNEVELFNVDLGFFRTFSILLFAFNSHLNVVPVASELVPPQDSAEASTSKSSQEELQQRATALMAARVAKITLRTALIEVVFYMLIAVGGYLSFLDKTDQNILKNYGTSTCVTICRTLLSFTILVGIPTNMLPTVRSTMGLFDALSGLNAASPFASPLLPADPEAPGGKPASRIPEHVLAQVQPSAGEQVYRLALTFASIAVQVFVAIRVPNVADVMGFLGGSVGTVLMLVLPLLVLIRAPPDDFSKLRRVGTGLLLFLGIAVAFTAVGLQLFGF